MPALAARIAVAFAAAVVVVTGLEALRARHPYLSAGPPAAAEPEAAHDGLSPRLGSALLPAPEPEALAPARPRGAFAMARIHGHVAGDKAALDDLDLEVADATRTYDPRVEDNGVFEINLPPGSYTLSATSHDLVALADVTGLAEEEDREVTLVLGPGAVIAGQIEGCDGPCSGVQVANHGQGARDGEDGTVSDDDGSFTLRGLVPNKHYDLSFTAAGMRRLVVRNLAPPTTGLHVRMEPNASLAGGFGLAAGEKCPMETVSVTEPGAATDDFEGRFDRHCRFEISPLPDADTVHLSASGTGWHFEVDVPVPVQGDPPFLCLHPPCRDPGPEAKASLMVSLQGVPSHGAYLSVEGSAGRVRSSGGCRWTAGACVLEDLSPDPDATVEVSAHGCETRTSKVRLSPGNNYLTYTCERTRDLQGIIRRSDDSQPISDAVVRCASGQPEVNAMGFVFHLRCPARLTTIEYRLGDAGPWLTAPVPAGDAADLGFVAIDVG
jgi:hypothetical protein